MEGSLLLFLCVFFFVLGFLSVALFVSWKQAEHVRREWTEKSPQWTSIGCKKVLQLAEKEPPPTSLTLNKSLTGVESIDKELEEVLGFGTRDYFEKWYHPYISPDPVCIQQAREVVDHVIKEAAERTKQVDYLSYFVETIMDDFVDHLRLYKRAKQTVESDVSAADGSTSKSKQIERAFFDAECKDDPWKAVCCSRDARLAYLRRLTEFLLYLLLPEKEFTTAPLQVLITDIIVFQVWTPLLKTLTQPDYFNATIISMCKDSALNPDTFMASITEGATNAELIWLQSKLRIHIAHVQKTGITDVHQQKLSALESVMETAERIISGENTIRSNNQNTSLLSLDVSVPKFSISHEGSTRHCIFHIHVKCAHNNASVVEQWVTYRRHRDFQDFNRTLRNQLANFPSALTIPTLPSFNKFDPQRLEVRRLALENYLKVVSSERFLKEHNHSLGLVVKFLTEGEYTRQSNEVTRRVDSLVQPLWIKATRAVKATTSVLSSSSSSSGSSSSPNSTPKPSPSQPRKQPSPADAKLPPEEDEDSLPVDMMLDLLNELFDLKDLQWLRRQLPVLLKQLAGERISRKIVRTTDWLTSAEQASEYIHKMGSTLWPEGYPASPNPPPSKEVLALRTLLARAKLIGSIPDDLRRIIGSETTVKGMTRLFNMMQSETLNYRLALLLLEGLLDILFPSGNLKDTFKKLRCEINARY